MHELGRLSAHKLDGKVDKRCDKRYNDHFRHWPFEILSVFAPFSNAHIELDEEASE